ncbi:hypothetical protein BV898_17590 [Hypsibius exemplaris]|uniref:Gustatory receptor n=1 Tax=Hypsibius exemplaris TaxID=2072580 RepID=A0A9X6NMJ7_HYPEX|nr:hypothetical protein BV898_17590 [Hypsibius exemplaris]
MESLVETSSPCRAAMLRQTYSSDFTMTVQIDRIGDLDLNDTIKRRRKYLSRSLRKFLWLFRGFGIIRPYGQQRNIKAARVFSIFRLITAVSIILFFAAQLTYMYVTAAKNLPTVTVLKLHFLSRLQTTVITALGMVILATRTRDLSAVVSDLVRACVWTNDTDFRHLRWATIFSPLYCWLTLAMLPIGMAVKVFAVRHLKDSLFGGTLPAEMVSAVLMLSETGTAIFFRALHLSVIILICLTLGVQFRRITTDFRQAYGGDRDDQNPEAFVRRMNELLRRHYDLSKLVQRFDAIFSATLFLFTASDLANVTSLISYFISGSQLEAPLGHYVTQSATDNVVYIICAIGSVEVLLTRTAVTAYLSYHAESCIPECYTLLEDPGIGGQLEKHIHRTLQRLRDVPVVLTGWRLISMNRNFILTVLGVVSTYMVVAVQISTKGGPGGIEPTLTQTSSDFGLMTNNSNV